MRRTGAFAVVAALTSAVVGYGVADAYDHVPGVLTIDEPVPSAVASPAPGGGVTSAVPALPAAAPSARPLPTLATSAPRPAPAAVAEALAAAVADPALGPSVGASVRDAATGAHLLDKDPTTPRTPASTMKVLTAAAIVEPLGPATRFTTSVVQGARPGQVVLVAGGDMLLGAGESAPGAVEGHAGLATLARRTAAALKASGVSKVTLGVDLSYAAGPDFAPAWDRRDLAPGFVGKVTTLGLASDLVEHGRPAQENPSGAAAAAFASALTRAGVPVAGAPVPTTAPAAARTLARVESAPAADVLAVALARSDNALTESLARQAAVRAKVPLGARPFEAVAAWVRARLVTLGYDVTGLRSVDTCGLARGQLAPARLVADVLARGASGTDPALQAVIAGLPIGGLTGTLADRFDTPRATGAAGIARAKTGTLTGVSAMAGTVVDADGRLLVYALVADRVPPLGTDSARQALDRLVSALAACGCR